MRVLIVGGSGFVGSAVAARLAADGHAVVSVSRGLPAAGLMPVERVGLDVAKATRPDDWLPLLHGVEAVINCAGTLQDGPGDSTHGVHVAGIAALFEACERTGVRRVIHLSAVGVDRETPSEFSRTKREAEQTLMTRNLDWVILRPSVVIGRAAYGGSALIRGLAALPVFPLMPGAGALQLVHLDDLVDTVVFFLQPAAPVRQAIDVVGPRRWTFADSVGLMRRWLRRPPARQLAVPEWAASLLYRVGDFAGLLGWRPPVRSTAQLEIRRGAVGDATQWRDLSGIAPRDIEQALAREPASVQERWFANLYLLKPLVFGVFGLFWIGTGLIALGPGWNVGMSYVLEGGMSESMAALAVAAGALADIAIGLAILYRPTSRYGLYAALAISLAYAIIGTILVPRLWSDPLGPMLKIWPIMVFNLVALAILEDR
jgi:uncharacterized protein YbjT (DUF2867 family)